MVQWRTLLKVILKCGKFLDSLRRTQCQGVYHSISHLTLHKTQLLVNWREIKRNKQQIFKRISAHHVWYCARTESRCIIRRHSIASNRCCEIGGGGGGKPREKSVTGKPIWNTHFTSKCTVCNFAYLTSLDVYLYGLRKPTQSPDQDRWLFSSESPRWPLPVLQTRQQSVHITYCFLNLARHNTNTTCKFVPVHAMNAYKGSRRKSLADPSGSAFCVGLRPLAC
jgi:hypothetical protein